MKTQKALFVLSLFLVSLFAAQVMAVTLKQACSPTQAAQRSGGSGLKAAEADDDKPFPPFGEVPLAPLPCACGKYVTSLWVLSGEDEYDLIDCFRCPLHNDEIRYSLACEDCCPPE